MRARVTVPQRVVTKVWGSTVWLVVGSSLPVGSVLPPSGKGRILVSRLK